jgi:hypothetical protein
MAVQLDGRTAPGYNPLESAQGGIMTLHDPQATEQALGILRKADNFQWYVLPLFVFALYVYFSQLSKKNYKAVASGLCLYAIHWLFEIMNALIRHFSGHALWTVPAGTSYLLLVGVGIELSLMFSVAGVVAALMLPSDPKARILGMNSRLFVGLFNAALASILEIFLASTPAFVWVYPWWNALTVGVFVYVPFFVTSAFCHDWKPRTQRIVIGSVFGLDAALLLLFALVLKWI